MTFITPSDAMFLASETREHPMHVGGLHVFRLPDGAAPDYVHDLYQRLLESTELATMYRRKPAWPGPLAGGAALGGRRRRRPRLPRAAFGAAAARRGA